MIESKIILGLMRVQNKTCSEIEKLIVEALNLGINFFDISDIYCNGEAEKKLGEVLKNNPTLRKRMIIQTKGGINLNNGNTYYDNSYQYLNKALNNSLNRLNLDYIDYYLIHRPDIFIDKEEILKFYNENINSKFLNFGVSNFSKELLKYLKDIDIKVNQLQFGLGHQNLINREINLNTNNKEGLESDDGLFFYMKRNNISLQCWSPFQYGMFEGSIFNKEKFPELNDLLDKLSLKYGVSVNAIAIRYLLMISDNIKVIIGTTNVDHLKDSSKALSISLTKEEWYSLYKASKNPLP